MDKVEFKDTGNEHLACALVLDTSSSMGFEDRRVDGKLPIERLNEALKRFKDNASKDPLTKSRVDILLIEFNDAAKIACNWKPICNMETPVFTAGGETNLNDALKLAVAEIRKECERYSDAEIGFYRPWLVLITDGEPQPANIDEGVQAVKERVDLERLKVIPIGVGNYDKTVLGKLSKDVIELGNYSFNEFFTWLHESMKIIAASRPDDKVQSAEIKGNMKVIDL